MSVFVLHAVHCTSMLLFFYGELFFFFFENGTIEQSLLVFILNA